MIARPEAAFWSQISFQLNCTDYQECSSPLNIRKQGSVDKQEGLKCKCPAKRLHFIQFTWSKNIFEQGCIPLCSDQWGCAKSSCPASWLNSVYFLLESSILVKLAVILHTKPFICVAVYIHMHCNPSRGCGGLHSTVHYKGWSHCCEGVPYLVILLPGWTNHYINSCQIGRNITRTSFRLWCCVHANVI